MNPDLKPDQTNQTHEDEPERQWDGREWAGEESRSSGEQGHWNRREWVGDQDGANEASRGDRLPDEEGIPREDLDRGEPHGFSGEGHNPEHAHWADTDGDR